MRQIARMAAVLLVFAAQAWAGTFDGTYNFTSRTKAGAPDMPGWSGQMQIQHNTMHRTYKSPDGAISKFYTASMAPAGGAYQFKFTAAYKPEYVGTEFKNKLSLQGNTLTMESDDGTFKEVWTKR